VFHSHDYSFLDEFKRYFDIGVFHTNTSWLQQTFGGASGEGLRFVISEMRYLMSMPLADSLRSVADRLSGLDQAGQLTYGIAASYS